MTLTDIPLLAMLKGKMGYVSQRQSVISQNVANADTPGYAPKDLKAFSFDLEQQTGSNSFVLATARTSAMHLESEEKVGTAWGAQSKGDSEVRLDGNQVVLEEQMVKLQGAKMDFDAAVGFYQQSLGLLKTAMKKPGS